MSSIVSRAAKIFRNEGILPLGQRVYQYIFRTQSVPKHILKIRPSDYTLDEISRILQCPLRYYYGNTRGHKWSFIQSLEILESLEPNSQTVDGAVSTAFRYLGWGPYYSIRPMQSRSELKGAAQYFKEREPETFVEIGTARGGTLYTWSRAIPSISTLVSIDLPSEQTTAVNNTPPKFLQSICEETVSNVHCIRKDSQCDSTVEEVENLTENGIDVLFLDGDHTYEGVKSDFEQYKQIVSEDGMIGFHDIVGADGPRRFWRELSNDYVTKEFFAPEGRITGDFKAGIGIVEL
jgi:cephalosporin hydroxylase